MSNFSAISRLPLIRW